MRKLKLYVVSIVLSFQQHNLCHFKFYFKKVIEIIDKHGFLQFICIGNSRS